MMRTGPIFASTLLLITAIRASGEPVAAPRAASPSGQSVSYSIWAIDGATVRIRFMLPTSQVAALVPPNASLPRRQAVGDAVSTALSVTSTGGACPAIVQGEGVGTIYALSLTPGIDRFEMIFVCPSATGIVLHDQLLFDRVRSHVDYARIQVGGDKPKLRMFTRDARSIAVSQSAEADMPASAMRGAYGLAGVVTKLCLLVGLMFLCRIWSDVGHVGAGLVVGSLGGMLMAAQGLVAASPMLSAAALALIVSALGASGLRGRARAEGALTRGWSIAARAALALSAFGAVAAASRMTDGGGIAIAGVVVVCLVLIWAAGWAPRPYWVLWLPGLLFGVFNTMERASELALLELSPGTTLPFLAADAVGADGLAILILAGGMAAALLTRRRFGSRHAVVADGIGAVLIGVGTFEFLSGLAV